METREPNRVDRRKVRTRAALIGAAQRLLAERRTAVSIQEITDTADVGFGSFYNHFESKDALFEAAIEETLQAYGAILDDLVSDIEDPAEVFAASFRLSGRLQRRLPETVQVLLNCGMHILVHDQGLAPRARRDLAAAHAAGRLEVPDVELGLMAVGGALLGLLQHLEVHPELDDAQVSDELTRGVLGMLGLAADEARELCSRPLPEVPDLMNPSERFSTPGPA